MASQSDSDLAAPVDGPAGIDSLPPALLVGILAFVPVETRLRCREVARAWRDALANRRAWARIDLSEAAGVQPERVTYKLVEAAVARAGGELEALNLSSCRRTFRSIVQRLAAGNAGTLRELRLFQSPVFCPGSLIRSRCRRCRSHTRSPRPRRPRSCRHNNRQRGASASRR